MKKLDYLILIPTDPTYVPSDEQAEAGADALEALLLQVPGARVHDDLVAFVEWLLADVRRQRVERGEALAPASRPMPL